MPGPGDISRTTSWCSSALLPTDLTAPRDRARCANPVLPAVANAIFNAVGVRIDELPITAEKVCAH